MRHLSFIIFLISSTFAFAQDKTNYVHYNKLIELKGTEYVLATVENMGKMFSSNGKYLLFINTKNGQSKQIDFPKDAQIRKVEQIKIDSLGINKVIVVANTVNLDNDKSIDWHDPTQIIILSTDGKDKVQLTEDKFFVSTWTTNSQTATIVVTGHYDSNNNGKYDKTDKNEVVIYDLKTLKLIARI
jgi:hypothetical protein